MGDLLALAAGLGDPPGVLGGILIIAGIALLFAIGGFAFHLVVHKGYLRNRGTAAKGDEHRPGRL
jgi:hypothetical protein